MPNTVGSNTSGHLFDTSFTTSGMLYSAASGVITSLSTGNSLLPATNSSGTLAMRAFTINVQTFTSNGTYTPTTGMLFCIVECVGGGGGGGYALGNASNTAAGAGGGGAGYIRAVFSAATIGASQAVTIGGAGSGGVASGPTNATNGGDTTFGALLTGNHGVAGGSSAGAATNGQVLGPVGTLAGTIPSWSGGNGGSSFWIAGSLAVGGSGGMAGGGSGGAGRQAILVATGHTNGLGSNGFGTGGGGGVQITSATGA